jgi:hypothetical protein
MLLFPAALIGVVAQDVKQAQVVVPPSASEPADPLGKALKASKLIHTDIGGFYKIRYDYSGNKRSQTVYIRQTVWEYNSMRVQEVYSMFYESEQVPSAELLQTYFQKGFSIGGLVLEAPSETQKLWRIRYRIDAPASSTPERLKEYLRLAAGTADALEKELGSEDKL